MHVQNLQQQVFDPVRSEDWDIRVVRTISAEKHIFIEPIRAGRGERGHFLDFEREGFSDAIADYHDIDKIVVVGLEEFFAGAMSEEAAKRFDDSLTAMLNFFADGYLPIIWKTRAGLVTPFSRQLSAAFERLSGLLRTEVELPSLDDSLVGRLTAGLSARAKDRLRLMRAMHRRGSNVTLRMSPLVPMINDDANTLSEVMNAAYENGARAVDVRYFTLIRGQKQRVWAKLSRLNRDFMRTCFSHQRWKVGGSLNNRGIQQGAQKLLPAEMREEGHRRARQIAGEVGLRVVIPEVEGLSKLTQLPSSVSARRASQLPGNATLPPRMSQITMFDNDES